MTFHSMHSYYSNSVQTVGVYVTFEYRNIMRVDCLLYREPFSLRNGLRLVCSVDYTEQSMDGITLSKWMPIITQNPTP